jgi:hypothetical protein
MKTSNNLNKEMPVSHECYLLYNISKQGCLISGVSLLVKALSLPFLLSKIYLSNSGFFHIY